MIISKNTKIFLALFSIVLFILTAIAIVHTNTNKGSDESQVIVEDARQMNVTSVDSTTGMNDTTKGLSLMDTYYSNGLTYIYKSSEKNGVPITYPIIYGLNDSEVQMSVNDQIVQKIYKVLDSNNFKRNSDESAYVTATVVGNFSDVLSIKIFAKFSESFSKYYGVNFRLDNGERIKLSEIFTYNAPKKNIITENAYRSFALGYYTAEGLSNEFYSNIDSDVLNFLLDYNNGRVAEFSFTPMCLELYRDGRNVRIEMQKYAEYIAIYNRFKSDGNLYSDVDNVIKGVPVFTQRGSALIDLYEMVNDRCILDICILKSDREDNDFSDEEMEVINNFKYDLTLKLKDIKREKCIYYSNYITVSRGREDSTNVLIFTENEAFIKTFEKDFEEYYNKILQAERDIFNEDYSSSKIHVLGENNLYKGIFETKYSMETGREYVKEPEEEDEEQEQSLSSEGSGHSESNGSPMPTDEPTPEPTSSDRSDSEPSSSPEQEPTQSPMPTGNITTQVYF